MRSGQRLTRYLRALPSKKLSRYAMSSVSNYTQTPGNPIVYFFERRGNNISFISRAMRSCMHGTMPFTSAVHPWVSVTQRALCTKYMSVSTLSRALILCVFRSRRALHTDQLSFQGMPSRWSKTLALTRDGYPENAQANPACYMSGLPARCAAVTVNVDGAFWRRKWLVLKQDMLSIHKSEVSPKVAFLTSE